METLNISLRTVMSFFALWGVFVLTGCQLGPRPEAPQETGAVFFPPAPDTPRLQFLKSFSGPGDVGAQGPSAFERFIVGETKEKGSIAKPYGMALYDGKLYVCDVGKRMVEVLDLEERSFSYMTKDRRLRKPVNIYIEDDGTKYVTDTTAGAVFVFDKNDTLSAVLGRELNINPIDVVVRGECMYLTDFTSNQVVVLDKDTGEEITRIGREGDGIGEFKLISDLALDEQGNIYVTDKVKARITKFDPGGKFLQTFGTLGDRLDQLIRPKGIAVDNEGRIWVVDGAAEVAKVYDAEGRLLLLFGYPPGNRPGLVNLPAKIVLDYDNVLLFQEYAVEGAQIEFLVMVSNQSGLNMINVYGFGSFPE